MATGTDGQADEALPIGEVPREELDALRRGEAGGDEPAPVPVPSLGATLDRATVLGEVLGAADDLSVQLDSLLAALEPVLEERVPVSHRAAITSQVQAVLRAQIRFERARRTA